MSLHRTSNSRQAQGAARRSKAGRKLSQSVKSEDQVTNSLTLQKAIAAPASASPETVLQLQRLAGNRAVERLLQSQTTGAKLTGAPIHDKYGQEVGRSDLQAKSNTSLRAPQSTVQRWPGKKKKKKTPDNVNKTYQETGEAPTGQNVYFILKVAIKTGTKTRGKASLSETLGGGGGHSWIEVKLGPDYPTLAEMIANAPQGQEVAQAIGEITKAQLAGNGSSTIGFYPDIQGNIDTAGILKQIFVDLPGKILEPEQEHFAGKQRGEKGFAITSPEAAIRLFQTIEEYRTHPYNILRHNCTDFAINAAKAAGLKLSGVTNEIGATSPVKLYKQLYKMAELGDQSAGYTDVTLAKNRRGKTYDIKHVSSKTQKRLEKKKRKMGFSTVPLPTKTKDIIAWKQKPLPEDGKPEPVENKPVIIAEHVIPEDRFLALIGGGMLRPGSKIGLTGVVNGDVCEVVANEGIIYRVYVEQFQASMGFPYPGTEPPQVENVLDQPQDIDQNLQDQPVDMDQPPVEQNPPEPKSPELEFDPQAWIGQELGLSKALAVTKGSQTITLDAGHRVYVMSVTNGFVIMDTGQFGYNFKAAVAEFKDAL